ncbi:hypothetical protein [Celeribacter marinus]|uniref:hypothetical protein n=1 Tax=Celeribacter marinus TaxID=1397108 RepID=UPI000780449C|nr:hypothetical protein [Celeribacter marinus]SFK80476.1 hypothetical protein SAMN05444421_108183 [Celeribacter marinus]
MTLLETTYSHLRKAGLVSCAEAFSTSYLGKNKNWYAFQTHSERDFSVGAAVQCLRSIRSNKALAGLDTQQRAALDGAERDLLAHLNKMYLVADVI